MLDKIKKLCAGKGININKLEELSDVGKNTIYRWGTMVPAADKLKRVADVLGVTVDELLKEDA